MVQDDILQAIDHDQCVMLLNLNWYTVDHCILLARITEWFGMMARLVTGLSHSLVSECSLFLLVVPAAHPFCHWTVAFPRALLWICYYTCFLLTHWWHKTIGITTFLFTFMLTILCFTYHLSRLFWVTFPWPGHTPRWNPVLMIPINVC